MLTLDYDRLGFRSGVRVLDVGCGEGRHSFESYRRAASLVVSLDLDRSALAKTKGLLGVMSAEHEGIGNFVAVCADGNRMPFADGFFDIVLCSETLEHIPSDRAVMSELTRVLRPGGALGISVPRWFPERVCWGLSREYYEVPGGHVRIYDEADLVVSFEALDLKVAGHHYAHALHSPYWWMRCAFDKPGARSALADGYHRVLVWEIENGPTFLSTLEHWLNPVIGKSAVYYFDKPLRRDDSQFMEPGIQIPQ